MKDFFATLRQQFTDMGGATKAVLGLALLAFVGIAAFASTWASRPSFTLLYSDLDPRHAAAVQAALATANVRFQVSQPPGPFVIHVDESQYYIAQNAVAISGALDSAPEGIQTNGAGASQVFLSAPERAQNVLKREWQELEKQLEELDFVQRAHVSTSTPDSSPLRKSAPMTVAVTLTLRGRAELSRGQASTVAKIVQYRFGVPQDNVIISDQSGRNLFEAPSDANGAGVASDLLDHRRRHDEELASKTNQVLDRIFGPGLAYVVVSSDWTYEEVESVKETLDPKNKVVVQETSNKSTMPPDSNPSGGGVAGATSNLTAEFGSNNAAIPPKTAEATTTTGVGATTSESQKSTIVGRETQLSKSKAPKLAHLSLSLFLDDSQKDRLKDLESSVKASIGFDEKRGDSFSSMVTPFASVKRDDAGKVVAPEVPKESAEPSRFTQMLVERGIEIAAAVAFLFLLVKTLAGAKKSTIRTAAQTTAAEEPQLDDHMLELLARGEIEELLKSDPARVSSILSRWAAEEETVGAGR
jgi:flagellar M-ring protein FliF